jgi:thymidylate kinase/thymidylate synthase ThyX
MDELRQGTFIVIEGTDGSGKGTQFKILADYLRAQGHAVETFDFPQYDQASSHFVKKYLNGEYGGLDDVGPYTASLFYALDRYEAAGKIRQALTDGKIVLANRFTGANMGHQGTKFNNAEERRGYFIWLDNLEYEMLKIPRPDTSIVLRVPAETAQQLVDQKEKRNYTDKKRDLHEADLAHLQKAVAVYDELCQLFPKDFQRVDCVRDGQLLSIETVTEIIKQKIVPLLPTAKPTEKGEIIKNKPSNPFVAKDKNGQHQITAEGEKFLAEAVTNSQSNVYGFYDKLSPITIAAAMARLSRRAGDMRVTILDEFAGHQGKDEKLLQRVITAYGDDSVQQLVGQHVVVEGASQLLTKQLEWGRLAAYLEQSTRYIYYDQKDENGDYNYFVPAYFRPDVKAHYKRYLDKIFDLYSEIVHKLTDYIIANDKTPASERDAAWKGAVRAQACDAARPLLPVATRSTVGIFASGQALENLIMHLQSSDLPEAQETGNQILTEARKTVPTFLERADKPDRGGATIAYRSNTRHAVRELAQKYVKETYASPSQEVQLTSVWPRNELDIVADMLYEHSNLPLKELQEMVATWPYKQKLEVFEAYIGERLNRRHKPGRALEKIHYSWDLVCDYGSFRDLQRHRMVDDLQWQELTPRYGYDVPQLVDDAGLTEQFEDCFDISLKLHSLLQSESYAQEAQYATLLGHKMRWKITLNARAAFHLHELRTSPQGHPGYRKLVKQMHDRLSEVHPLIGEAMRFVNKGEDAELTRLAAERYTQFKLQQLDT